MQSTFSGWNRLRAKDGRTLLNPIVNHGDATVDLSNIGRGTARYTWRTRQVQDYLEEDSDCMWIAKRRALLDVWPGRNEEFLNLDATHDDKFWMPRSETLILLSRKYLAAKCRSNDFEAVTSDRYPTFFVIATSEEKSSLFSCSGSKLYVFYIEAKRHAFAKRLQSERVIIFSILRICWTWQSAICRGWMEREPLFALSFSFHSVSCIC